MNYAYAIAAFALLAFGTSALTVALLMMRKTCAAARVHSRMCAAFPALIVIVITACVAFAFVIARRGVGLDELIVSAAFSFVCCLVWGASHIGRLVTHETQRIAALERHRAAHDPLTSLPNRLFFLRQLQRAIADATGVRRLAVLIMDLDRFKLVNNTLGHHYGDILLQEVSIRIQSGLRKSDFVARLGGDEFGILIDPVDSPEHPEIIAQHVASVVEPPFAMEGYPADVGASIGVAYYPEHGIDSNVLMKNAEIAMYEAKQRGADVKVYDASLDTHDLNRLNILSELRKAIDQAGLLVHYQPQFAAKTGKLSGVEALVRWPHSRFGPLLPEEFIGLAEQSGLINRLNRSVLDIVLRQLAEWRATGIDIPISTNISVVNLQDPDLFQYIVDGLRTRELAAKQLKLEITETAVMSNPEVALEAVKRLSDFGVRFSIDDFGTGYSSLVYLRELPIDEIKIDRSFVVNMTRDNNDAIIVRSTIDLAHNMGRLVAAEGVESQESMEILTRWHCDVLQGYYLSPPLTAEELNLKLKDPSSWSPPPAVHAN